jgi:uncharacterized protein (TIGR03437 family)
LNTQGALVYATYITGSCGDSAYGLALDSAGDAYVAGETYARDFPVTPNAMSAKFAGLVSSGFVAELNPAGDQLLYSSFLGGGGYTAAHAVKLDGAGNIYLAGSTQASPTAGANHALSFAGCGAGAGSVQPGENPFVMRMALDAAGNLWLAGFNESADFPLKAPINGLNQNFQIQGSGFLAELNPTGSDLLSATGLYDAGAVAADSNAVYYFGTPGNTVTAVQVADIDPAQVAPISLDEIVQFSPLVTAAQRQPTSVAPGEIVRILGRGIGPSSPAKDYLIAAGTLATSIGGVQVTFNGVLAPLVSALASEIDCVAPFELDGLHSASVVVEYNGKTSNAYPVGVVPQNPDTLAVVNSDWSVNSQSNPAKPGSQVTIFLTGLGQTIPASVDGAINQLPPALLRTVPTFSLPYTTANVTFIGAAALEVGGVSQLNIAVPASAPSSFSVYFDLNVYTALANVYVAQ